MSEMTAKEFLESRGLADLSLYWPTNKPLPKIDYESGEAQPTLLQLMEAFAAQWKEKYEHINRLLVTNGSPLVFPLTCQCCGLTINGKDDFDWHGLGNCVELCSACLGSGMNKKNE